MARFSNRQFGFTNGEVSPRLHMRADMEFYYAGLAECVNWIPDHKGNLIRRPPTRFITESKAGQKPCLYPFNVGRDCPVVIEAYRDCFRFVIAREVVLDGDAPLEVPHSYGDDFCDLEFTQDCAAWFVVHENHAPAVLIKKDDTFTLEPIKTLPFGELNQDGDCRLCLAAGGTAGGASGSIQTSATCVVGDVLSDGENEFTITAVNGVGNYSVDTAPGGLSGDFIINSKNGVDLIVDPDGVPGSGDETDDTFSITAESATAILTSQNCEPFLETMVGQQIRLLDLDGQGGNDPSTWITVNIIGFNSAGELVVEYGGPEIKCTDLFQLPAYADGRYPETVWIFNDRLWFARENCVVGSTIGNFYDWQPSDPDGKVQGKNAIYKKINQGECDDIRWLWPMGRQLVVGTKGGLQSLLGSGVGGSFQAGSVAEQSNQNIGVADIRPVQVGEAIFFVDRSRTKIYGTGFTAQYDHIGVDEQTIYADHIGDCLFKKIVYQQHPYSIIWGITDDDQLVSLTAVPSQGVKGWARHKLGGQLLLGGCCTDPHVCDIAAVHGPDEQTDDVYLTVKRTINGADVFYIEVIDSFYDNKTHYFEAGHLDAYLPLQNITAGLDALAGDGPEPFSLPPQSAQGNYSVYDGENWVEFKSDGVVSAPIAPNTFDRPKHGRDWTADPNLCEWERLSKPKLCDDADYVMFDRMVYRQPCGVERVAACVDGLAGLHHLAGECVIAYSDGRLIEGEVSASGDMDVSGCVVRVGLPYDSTMTLLPYRTNLGSTDGANDPTRTVSIGVNVIDGVWLEAGTAEADDYNKEAHSFERILFDVNEFDRPLPFTGWADAPAFMDLHPNNESKVSIRARGPWPCIIRNVETIIDASGGR